MTLDLRPALAPGSIAIVGASERSFIARVAAENCQTIGYSGDLYAVHPRYEQVLGLPCYPSLAALPRTPDCALIALNAERAVGAVEEACALGVRVVVLPAGGFAEQGPEGAERQRRIVAAARAHGTLVVGPNCMGVLSPPDRAAVYIGTIARSLAPSTISVVAQSGSVVELVVNTAHLHFARVLSAGNEAALTVCDYLEFLLEDDQTAVILLYLEAYREPRRLLALAERALEIGKPLVVVALGRSAQAQAMAQAHSGALATSHRRLTAALRQRGALLCEDLDEWLATAQLAAALPPVRRADPARGPGIGAVTVSGGEGGLLLDLADGCGVWFPSPSEGARHELRTRFPAFQHWPNPADGWDKGPYEEVYPVLLAALAREPDVDVLVAAVDVPAGQGEEEARYTSFIGRALGEQARRAGKPGVCLSLVGGGLDERVRAALADHGTPLVGGARPGLRAIAHLAALQAARDSRGQLDVAPDGFPAPALKRLIAELPDGAVDEARSRRVLERAGVPLLPAVEVMDEAGAIAAAQRLPGPAALKAILPGVAHKSDAGAVALRLATAAEVGRAARRLLELCDRQAAPRRLLVSPYVEPVVEAICGIACDPDWGAFVLLGLGGVLAEALDELVITCAPLRMGQAEALATAGRIGRVVSSARRPADVPALVNLLRRLSWLAPLLWQIDPTFAVDLNPVMLLPPGAGAWAADALIARGLSHASVKEA